MTQNRFSSCTLIMLIGMLLGLFVSCSTSKKSISKKNRNTSGQPIGVNINSKVYAAYAPEWSNILVQQSGWLGADGIYSIPLDGVDKAGRAQETGTLLLFSDSIIGNVKDGKLENDWSLVHNTVAYLSKSDTKVPKVDFYYKKDGEGNPVSVFKPRTSNSNAKDIYWLGDGFVNKALDNTIYIFAYRVKSLDKGIYPFRIEGISLIKLSAGSRPPFDNQEQIETPLFHSGKEGNISFGSSIFVNTKAAGATNPDGYIYIYGVKGVEKKLIAARVKPKNFEHFANWRFWDGMKWTQDITSVKGLIPNVSNEMSISGLDNGKFLATYQLKTNSPDIVIQMGNTPVGPFHPYKKIWKTPEIYDGLSFYTYNAKAHPHLSQEGELLITYNVNSFDFLDDIVQHPHHLRPRFIRLKLFNK